MKKKDSKKKLMWDVSRTLLFTIIGLMNTIFAKPEDIGSYKNYLGMLFLVIAAVDALVLIFNFKKRYLKLKNNDA